MLLSGKASAQTDGIDSASFALTLESLEADFCAMVLNASVLYGDPLAWSRTSLTMRRITQRR